MLCDEALQHGFFGVCINPVFVSRAAKRMGESSSRLANGNLPRIISVVGFPLGASRTETKVEEARRAIGDGASEIDMVIHIGALLAGDNRAVRSDIEGVANVVHGDSSTHILKVILETAALSTEQIILGCRCCAEGEADFVKTSTGFHAKGGAIAAHVKLLRRHASPIRVKASGGIRSAHAAMEMLNAGADRLGTSASVTILREYGQHFS